MIYIFKLEGRFGIKANSDEEAKAKANAFVKGTLGINVNVTSVELIDNKSDNENKTQNPS